MQLVFSRIPRLASLYRILHNIDLDLSRLAYSQVRRSERDVCRRFLSNTTVHAHLMLLWTGKPFTLEAGLQQELCGPVR
jgi:hypothetical protein